jgi:hypothetical protein
MTQTNVFIIPFTMCLAQTGHHQVIFKEYTNGDGIHTIYKAIINFLDELCRAQHNTILSLDF